MRTLSGTISALTLTLLLAACGEAKPADVAADAGSKAGSEQEDVMSLDCADPAMTNVGIPDYFTKRSDFSTPEQAVAALMAEGESTEVDAQSADKARVAILRPDGTTRMLADASTSGKGWLIDKMSSCGGESLTQP
jgi:hypothetical protein